MKSARMRLFRANCRSDRQFDAEAAPSPHAERPSYRSRSSPKARRSMISIRRLPIGGSSAGPPRRKSGRSSRWRAQLRGRARNVGETAANGASMAVEVILPRVAPERRDGQAQPLARRRRRARARGPAVVRDRVRPGGDGGRGAGERRVARPARRGRRPGCRLARPSPGSSAKTSPSIPICRRSPASCARCWRRPRRRCNQTAPDDAPARSDDADERPLALPPAPALVIGAGARLNRLWLARGEGAPIVFIHGFGADLNGWRPLGRPSAGRLFRARARSARPRRFAVRRRNLARGADGGGRRDAGRRGGRGGASRRPFARRRSRGGADGRARLSRSVAGAHLSCRPRPGGQRRVSRRLPARALGSEPKPMDARTRRRSGGARFGAGQHDLAPAGGGRVGRSADPPRRGVVPRRRAGDRHSSLAGRDRHSRQGHRRRRGSRSFRPVRRRA